MKIVNSLFACLMLGIMFILMFFSSWGDSATFDETAHIPAGYSYLTQKEYRLNPEHPPLIKDLAAFPLLFLNLNFPTNSAAWKTEVNGQWDMGRIFLYQSGNNPDQILHYSHFPIMLLALFFGWLLFNWARKLYGDKVGLLTLFFYTFSPTFIAHSRYVTTDLGAAFGFFIGIVSFVWFLSKQKTSKSAKSLILAGVIFGLVQLFKFSLFLLVPLYFIFGILWVVLENYYERQKIFREILKMVGKIILIGAIGVLIIIGVYQFHIWNYPAQRQAQDTASILSTFPVKSLAKIDIWMADKPIIRPFGQYFLGFLMTLQRSGGGNTAYFMGEVTAAKGWWYYFPLLYLLKEHLAFHIFTVIAILFTIYCIKKSREKNLAAAVGWMKDNFPLTAGMIFVGVYWLYSIISPLNIGIRHVLPTFPFIYLLVSRQIIRWSRVPSINNPKTVWEWFKEIYDVCARSLKKHLVLWILTAWMILATLLAFPFYLSYYNELTGGTFNGYKIATDSNYDWGQDLKRLVKFVGNPPVGGNIQKIAVDYFGGGNPEYYLGDKFVAWWSAKNEPPLGTWFAVSANSREGSMAKPVKGWSIKPEDTYSWLKNKIPVARAGSSIFIYKF